LRELLEGRDDATLRRVRIAIGELLGNTIGGDKPKEHHTRIALIGLRGAGKSTLGEMLALELGFPFVELSREIEKLAGCGIAEIRDLYGAQTYRRYERRALLAVSVLVHPKACGTPEQGAHPGQCDRGCVR
jgi:XRE family aerobic/anaerobic benzoate catabolism transcriptional regulator